MSDSRPGMRPSIIPAIRPMGASVSPANHSHSRPASDSSAGLVDPLVGNSIRSEAGSPLTVVEESSVDAAADQQKRIRSYEEGARSRHHDFKRELHHANANASAVRVKSFRGKYSDSGLAFLDDTVNEWLDSHPEVDIKFVTSTTGMFEGKVREPALVLNIWY